MKKQKSASQPMTKADKREALPAGSKARRKADKKAGIRFTMTFTD